VKKWGDWYGKKLEMHFELLAPCSSLRLREDGIFIQQEAIQSVIQRSEMGLAAKRASQKRLLAETK
jgi:hypothetical protein